MNNNDNSKIIHIMYIISFIMMFILTSDLKQNYPSWYRYVALVIIFVLTFRSIYRNKKVVVSTRKSIIILLWLLFLIGIAVSALANNDFSKFYDFVFAFIFYFIVIIESDLCVEDLAIAAILVGLYVVYRCITMGVYYVYYNGTTYNSNQFAIIMVSSYLCALYFLIKWKSIIGRVIMFVISVLLFAYTAFSSSRTVVGTAAISTIIYFVLYLKGNSTLRNNRRNNKRKTLLYKKSTIIVLLSLTVTAICLLMQNYQFLIKFFMKKWNAVDITSGRMEIWKKIFQSSSIVGDYSNMVNSNSDVIEILKSYGIFPFVIYILILLFSIRVTYQNFKKYSSLKSIFSFVIVLSYIFIGLFEVIFALFGKPINIIFWCVYALAIKENNDNVFDN